MELSSRTTTVLRKDLVTLKLTNIYINKFFARATVCVLIFNTMVAFAAPRSTGSTSKKVSARPKTTIADFKNAKANEKRAVERHRLNREMVRSQVAGISDELISSLAQDPDELVQTGAAQELGNYVQNKGVVEALADALLKSKSATVRMAAARSLSLTNSPIATDALCTAIADRNPDVRGQVAFSLKFHKTKPAQKALDKLKADESPRVRQMAGGR